MVVCIWRNNRNPCKAIEGGLPYKAYERDSDLFELKERPDQATQSEPEYMEPVDKNLFSSSLKSSDNFSTTMEDDISDENSSLGSDKRKWFNTTIVNQATQPEPEYMEPVECTKPSIKDKKCKCCKCFNSSGTAMEYDSLDEASSPDSDKSKWFDKTKAKPNPYVLH